MKSKPVQFHENFQRPLCYKTGSEKSFGFTFSFIFFLFFLAAAFKSHTFHFPFFILFVGFGVLGFFLPHWLMPLNKFWLSLGLVLQKFFSPLVLAFLFFFIVTPTAFVLKIIGKDILDLKFDGLSHATSYWKNSKVSQNMTEQF